MMIFYSVILNLASAVLIGQPEVDGICILCQNPSFVGENDGLYLKCGHFFHRTCHSTTECPICPRRFHTYDLPTRSSEIDTESGLNSQPIHQIQTLSSSREKFLRCIISASIFSFGLLALYIFMLALGEMS